MIKRWKRHRQYVRELEQFVDLVVGAPVYICYMKHDPAIVVSSSAIARIVNVRNGNV